MTAPTLTTVTPPTGPTSGGDLVQLAGTGFAAAVRVQFGGTDAEVLAVRAGSPGMVIDLRTPAGVVGVVDVTVQNLDVTGAPILGELAIAAQSYTYRRTPLVDEADVTRLVRALLRELKRQVLPNVSLAVGLDYSDAPTDVLRTVALAALPALVLAGPGLVENRFLSSNVLAEDAVVGPSGPELVRRRPALTVDLTFSLTGVSNRTIELLNLMAVTTMFFNRNRWIAIPRDPADASQGIARWEMDLQGEVRSRLAGDDDLRVFTCGFVIRGFDLDEGLPLDLGKAVTEPDLDVGRVEGSS